ncbi:MAG: hypothetical protein KDK08_27365 [Rhizobiaceae bacterium]|nr:hypothetical protein [Rhizobiaceae bacterium]
MLRNIAKNAKDVSILLALLIDEERQHVGQRKLAPLAMMPRTPDWQP